MASASARPKKLAKLAAVRRLSDRVVTVLGQNPGKFTLQGTNTYIVGTGKDRMLIDCGEGRSEYIELFMNVLKKLKVENISIILISHHHADHLGGLPDLVKVFGDAEVYKCPLIPRLKDTPLLTEAELGHSWQGTRLPLIAVRPMKHNQVFRVEGATVRAVFTPGHTKDHMSFFLEEEHAVFSGDCVLGEGTCVFQDLGAYLRSLTVLGTLEPRVLYPGHGKTVRDPIGWLKEYIAHRAMRERQLMQKISAQPADEKSALCALELVDRVYENLPPQMRMAAGGNVLLHLKKLEAEGRIVRVLPPQKVPVPTESAKRSQRQEERRKRQQKQDMLRKARWMLANSERKAHASQ